MRNFQRLAMGADITPLLHALYQKPWLWNQFTVRTFHEQTAHREIDDIILRYNPYEKTEDFVEKVCSELFVVNYPPLVHLPEARPLMMQLMARVEGEHLGRCFISRMKPGAVIPPHTDRIAPAEEAFPGKPIPAVYYSRYHVVLQATPGTQFRCGEEVVFMAPGEVWWFDNEVEHEVVNNSDTDRIHLICDIHTPDFTYCPVDPPTG